MRIIIEVDTNLTDRGEHDPAAVVNNVIQALDSRKHCADVDSVRMIVDDIGQGIGTLEITHGPLTDHLRAKWRIVSTLMGQ